MELTREQENAVKIILDRYKSGEKYATLAGWAGTGKSVTIKFITDALTGVYGLDEDDICYACYCGKAVQVLIDRGNKNAMTLHKLLFDAVPMPDGKFFFKPKPYGSLEYKIIIVDEASMVSQDFVETLLKHPVFVIFVGDNGQLGPVQKGNENHLLDKPHAFLDTVMRQALDSDIIRLSMMVRNEENINGFKGNEAMVIPKRELVTGHLTWADQILCATNATRIGLNKQVRELKGYTQPIAEGEKLICLRNDWNTISECGNPLTNGNIGILTDMFETRQVYPKYMQVLGNQVPIIGGVFTTDAGDSFGNLLIDKKCIITGEPYLTPKQIYKIKKVKKYKDTIPYEFTYAYCCTTWKFQGSSAPKVLGIEERFPYDRIEHRRFLYTMITRAEDRCVIVRA